MRPARDRATISYFREIDSAGRAQEDLPSGWEEARKVTSILVDAVTPKDGYTADARSRSRPPLAAGWDGSRLERR